MLLFSSKPLETVTTWQRFRCAAKYQYSQSIPICNSLFIYFQQPAAAQGLNQKQMQVPLSHLPSLVSSKNWKLLMTWCTYTALWGAFLFANSELSRGQKVTPPPPRAPEILNQYEHVEAKVEYFSPNFCRAVCTVFSTWLSEYPEDFKSLGEPSRLLRLAPLLPQHSSADLRARLLRIAEELSERALLPDTHKGLCCNWDTLNTTASLLWKPKSAMFAIKCVNLWIEM